MQAIHSPWPNVNCESVFEAQPEHAQQAAQHTVEAFKALRAIPRFKRAEALRSISNAIGQRAEQFAALIRDECGKPMGLARIEAQRAVKVFAIAAEEALRPPGEFIYADRETQGVGATARVEVSPIGPILGITPFNFPLNLVAHKVAPALAAGCSIVVKPPPQAPGAALLLGQVVLESSLHPAALQVLPGGVELGKALCACTQFAAVSFTGSARAGWDIKRNAHPRQKVLLELGGNAPAIVDEFADLDAASSAIATAGYVYSGQVCISTQRVLVHRSVADAFERKLAATILRDVLVCDNPAGEKALVGPLIDVKSTDRIANWIDSALDAGASALIRGERRSPNFITPWLLEAVPPEQPLSCEEAFGPVVVLDVVADFDEALRRANASEYGLQASVFTQSLRNAERACRELEYGAVLVNLPTSFRLDSAPYGGIKGSGFGREGLSEVIRAFSEQKLCVIKP